MLQLITRGWKRIVGYFMAGLLAVLPLVLTVAIVAWVTSFLRDFLGPETMAGRVLAAVGIRLGTEGTLAYLIGIAVVILAMFVLGLLVELGAKRIYQSLLDAFLKKVPIVGSLYGSLKQMVEMFDRTEEAELKAMSVVFCYFGGVDGTGVLALMPSPEPIRIANQDYYVVIIPTAPIPFGGGLIFSPVELVKPVDMSVDQFISIYVSMGVTTPEFMKSALAAHRSSPN